MLFKNVVNIIAFKFDKKFSGAENGGPKVTSHSFGLTSQMRFSYTPCSHPILKNDTSGQEAGKLLHACVTFL